MDSEHYNDNKYEDEYELQYAAVQKLPTFKRITTALFDEKDVTGKRVVYVTKLGAKERHMFIEKLIKHNENDNLQLLQKIRERIDKVGIQLPSVEVRYKNLSVEPECEVVHGKLLLPTLWNATKSMFSGLTSLLGSKQEAKLRIIKDVSGVIKPGRFLEIYLNLIMVTDHTLSGYRRPKWKIVYHGPRSYVRKFFEDSGFQCPERKGVAEVFNAPKRKELLTSFKRRSTLQLYFH
ncbi:hypothetical protein Q3G72_007206 [Acer saccharum]|nr:hypothetical protein Q3G72_007206 [Acer saccharum]